MGGKNMQLDEAQRKTVSAWVAQGLKLSEIQTRLASDLGLRLTYMEVRLLVDDLKLVPKDTERPKPAPSLSGPSAGTAPGGQPAPGKSASPLAGEPNAPAGGGSGGVSVSVDQLARPGAVVSGKVTFSDGQRAEWYFDQTGRLALATQQPGYRPSPPDLQQFQAALDSELSRLGF
jgi:hypothetical protein